MSGQSWLTSPYLPRLLAERDGNDALEVTYVYGIGTSIGSTAIDNPYTFTGRRYDAETGLYYYRTRYMDPKAGPLISRHTIGLYGDPNNLGNGQAYVNNNPWTATDPYGEGPLEWINATPEQMFNYAFGGFITSFLEYFAGGDTTYSGRRHHYSGGGRGGVIGGAVSAATFRVVPTEANPSQLSRAGMETGAGLVVGADPAARLVTGESISGLPADRRIAAGEIALESIGFGLLIDTKQFAKLSSGIRRESRLILTEEAGMVLYPLRGARHAGPPSSAQLEFDFVRDLPQPEIPFAIRNAHLAGKRHPVTGIPFDEQGYPDFSSVAITRVDIEFSGHRPTDRARANAAAGLEQEPVGYIWHHHQNRTTMQLVPEEVHMRTGHDGGFTPPGR